MQCFRSFHTTERTIEGVEAAHMMRKGQVKIIFATEPCRTAYRNRDGRSAFSPMARRGVT
jgi:hypothetical protein